MLPIANIDEFKCYQASKEMIQQAEKVVTETHNANQSFLKTIKLEPPQKTINGTFIYAHPPDYRGRPMLNANQDDWQRVFKDLKSIGMNTVIFQASVWYELRECYYQSCMFSDWKIWNVLEPMLHAGALEKMTVFLGGFGSIAGWNANMTIGDVRNEIKLHIKCYEELMQWHELFTGFYFPCETAFKGQRNPEREKIMNCLYSELLSQLKELAPDKQIAISPGSKYVKGMEQEFFDAWKVMLNNVPLDILVPQDSIGCCGISLPDQAHMYKLWQSVAEACGVTLWGNIELFERVTFNKPNCFIPATPERVSAQINHAAPFTENLVCWEALYFLDNDNGPRATALRKHLLSI